MTESIATQQYIKKTLTFLNYHVQTSSFRVSVCACICLFRDVCLYLKLGSQLQTVEILLGKKRGRPCLSYISNCNGMCGLTFSTELDGKFATQALWKNGIISNFCKTSKLLFCCPKPLLPHSPNLLCDAIIKTHACIC